MNYYALFNGALFVGFCTLLCATNLILAGKGGYEIDNLTTPTSVQELINEGYLKEGQDRCPNGETVVIVDGQASTQ